MNYTHYLFAGFVFILLLSLIIIFDRLRRARMEQQDAIAEKERRLFTLYQNLEDMMDSMEEYVNNTTQEVRRHKEELEVMMAKMDNYAQSVNAAMLISSLPTPQKEAPGEHRPPPPQEEETPNAPPRRAGRKPRGGSPRRDESKAERVFRLKAEGYNADQIAQELSLSRGEVALIINLQNH